MTERSFRQSGSEEKDIYRILRQGNEDDWILDHSRKNWTAFFFAISYLRPHMKTFL